MARVLCIAVHPDDETLGCGGTLFKHAGVGDSISWLILTDMKTELGFSDEARDRRDREIESISALYGFEHVVRLGFPTTQLDRVGQREIVEAIVEAVRKVMPEILYLPFHGDAHSDHKVAFEASISVLKSFRFPYIKRALMMEAPSETEYCFPPAVGFAPNVHVDISATCDRKIEAMKHYVSESGAAPFPRSERIIRSLANFRGSFIGTEYAEAFELLKDVWI